MPVARLFFAALSMLPVQRVIRPIKILKKNDAPVWIKLPMFAMDVFDKLNKKFYITLAIEFYTEQLKNGWDYTCKQVQTTNPKDFQVIAICYNRDTEVLYSNEYQPFLRETNPGNQ